MKGNQLAKAFITTVAKGAQLALTLEVLARHSPTFIKELKELMLKHSPNPVTSVHIQNLFKNE